MHPALTRPVGIRILEPTQRVSREELDRRDARYRAIRERAHAKSWAEDATLVGSIRTSLSSLHAVNSNGGGGTRSRAVSGNSAAGIRRNNGVMAAMGPVEAYRRRRQSLPAWQHSTSSAAASSATSHQASGDGQAQRNRTQSIHARSPSSSSAAASSAPTTAAALIAATTLQSIPSHQSRSSQHSSSASFGGDSAITAIYDVHETLRVTNAGGNGAGGGGAFTGHSQPWVYNYYIGSSFIPTRAPPPPTAATIDPRQRQQGAASSGTSRPFPSISASTSAAGHGHARRRSRLPSVLRKLLR